MSGSYDVIVIGAGCAGLSAAVRLAGQGARVLVLEARSRLGGRATAFRDRETGQLVDNGQHVLLGCYHETFAFLAAIGASDAVRLQSHLGVTMVLPDGRVTRLDCPNLPAPLHLVAGIFDWDALTWSDKWSALRMAGPLRLARQALAPGAQVAAASPGETVERWLIRHGQSRRLRELLWEPLALAALNQPASQASAPPFARVLAEMFSGDPRAAAIALPTRPLHLMYAEPARAYIEQRGGVVRTGATARVLIEGRSVVGVQVADERELAPVVVSAVPWFAFPALVQPEPPALRAVVENASRLKSSPIVTVNLWFDRPVLEEPFVGLPGRVMQWVFDKQAVFGGEASHVSLVSSGAADLYERTNTEIIATAQDELSGALRAAARARLVRATVIREPRATFSLAPGQPPRPAAETDISGLFLAGDWIETGLPATIEGAVRSGHRAAALASSSR